MIFLAKGKCFLGRRRIDGNGNVVEESAARFETDPEGGSVAVGWYCLEPESWECESCPAKDICEYRAEDEE